MAAKVYFNECATDRIQLSNKLYTGVCLLIKLGDIIHRNFEYVSFYSQSIYLIHTYCTSEEPLQFHSSPFFFLLEKLFIPVIL